MTQSASSQVNLYSAIVCGVGSFVNWAAGLVGQAAPGPATEAVASQAGSAGVWIGLIGLATLIVNAINTQYTARHNIDQKVAEAKAEADRKLAEAKAESDAEIAVIKAEAAQARADVAAAKDRRKIERDIAQIKSLEQDSQVLGLQKDRDTLFAFIREIAPRLEVAGAGIDANSAGIRTLGKELGVPVPTAPKMDGGAGLMDIPAADTLPVHSGPRMRVLVLDDSGEYRAKVCQRFRAAGWEVIEASDGFSATSQIHSSAQFPPDVMLIDLMLPTGSASGEEPVGVEVIRMVRLTGLRSLATGAPVRLIAFTGLDMESPEVKAAIAAGVDAVQAKPADFERILAVCLGEHPGDVAIPSKIGATA